MNAINFFPLTDSTKTVSGGNKVLFKITNQSNETLNLKWMDYNGNWVAYGTVNPHADKMQDTAVGHVWELVSDDGKVGIKFDVNSSGELIINSAYQPSFVDSGEKIIQTSDGLWSSTMGYGLVDAAASLGLTHNQSLNLGGQNNYAALNAIDAPTAWAAGYTGKGVKVAIIDGGIAANPEIAGKIVGGYDFQDRDTDPSPDNGTYRDHALGVASIIAASHSVHSGPDTMGVAPDAQLLNVRVGSSQGSSSNNMADGIHWAVDNGAKVICMPLESNATQVDQLVANAIDYAYQHNVVVVVIGGNYSSFQPTGPALIAQQLKGEVIDVGNYDLLAGVPFGSSNQPGASPFPWVMASSSGYVPNSNGGYTYWNDGGTSFAGPYVAGVAALLWQQNPNATAGQIIQKIVTGADLGTQTLFAHDVGVGEISGEAYRLYQAAFNRTPDDKGLSFWINSMQHGTSLHDAANAFVESAEFQSLYGAHPSNNDLINAMYHNVLHRDADASGLSYWSNAMDHGLSAADLLSNFSESAENVAQVAKVIGQGFEYLPYV